MGPVRLPAAMIDQLIAAAAEITLCGDDLERATSLLEPKIP
jgi:hypothetical protein